MTFTPAAYLNGVIDVVGDVFPGWENVAAYTGDLNAALKPVEQTLIWVTHFGYERTSGISGDDLPDAEGTFFNVYSTAFITEPDTPDRMGLLRCQDRAARLLAMLYRCRFVLESFEGSLPVMAEPLNDKPEAGAFIYLVHWEDTLDIETGLVIEPEIPAVPLQRVIFQGDVEGSSS